MLPALELDQDQVQSECERIVGFIRDTLRDASHTRAVLGMSGGIDSALVAALCARALGPENVLGIMMPHATSNPDSEAHARLAIEELGIQWGQAEITGVVQSLVDHFPEMDAHRRGNVMARSRIMILFDQSVAFGGLVAGTSNRTETLLGYFTLCGDGAASFKPIAHLYKCQVRALSRYLCVPQPIIDKAPSADLWAGQTDEGELGFSYDEADQVLFLLTERHLDQEQIAAQGFDSSVVRAIARRMQTTAFKRRPIPTLAID